jgi:hypothetical protein
MKKLLILFALLTPAFAQRPALVSPVIRFSDSNGKPLVGGMLYSYVAGTTTPLATYQNATTGTLNANPTILDSTGSASIFLGTGVYKFVLQNSASVVQWTADNIAQSGFATSFVTSFNSRTGAVAPVSGDYSCAQVTGAICSLPTLYNQTIAVSGTAAPQEPILNFIAGVSGSVNNPTVTAGGSGYIGAPSVAFSGGACVTQPTGSTTVASGAVTALILVTTGAGCTSPPTAAFSGGGGTGATATVALVPDGIACVDNPGSTRTDCTMTFGGGGGGSPVPIVQNDVTSVRSFNTVYQNTATTAMYVSGNGVITGGAGDSASMCLDGTGSPPTVQVIGFTYSYTNPGEATGFNCFIPPGYYYEITAVNHISSSPQHWIEYTGFSGGGGGGSGVTASYNPASGNLISFVNGSAASIGAPFSITSFTCTQCGNFELGYSISSASGTASYANPTVPTSASVSDGTNTVTLTTPFTSWTESHTYTNATFTLTAVGNSQTQTASQSFNATLYCTFSGLGTGGAASGAMASGSGAGNQCASETATLAGATATLASNGLGNTTAGQSFTFNPSGQYIYLLLTGGCGHTLYVNGFSTAFSTQALTYTNILGGSQTGMCVYSSPTFYTATGTNVTVHSL